MMDYLESLPNINIKGIAKQVWFDIESTVSLLGRKLDEPDACFGNTNNFMFTWSKEDHYLECEIFDGGDIEFFYINNGFLWGEDIKLGQPLTPTILEKLTLFSEKLICK